MEGHQEKECVKGERYRRPEGKIRNDVLLRGWPTGEGNSQPRRVRRVGGELREELPKSPILEGGGFSRNGKLGNVRQP